MKRKPSNCDVRHIEIPCLFPCEHPRVLDISQVMSRRYLGLASPERVAVRVTADASYPRIEGATQMTLQRPRSRPSVETPIERIFRKTMKRQMTKAERG